ncbi:hypothetical protein DPMN_025789 [Dreissena polymorpha]|uniref:Uncharacterized protein n=1 Tax=Dreissena polymorpha TaxID=45954 RepID=A0A9D4RC56_DREPO|nr:hypothetical protein DPMN_025789 [Dreissena polymorpha]
MTLTINIQQNLHSPVFSTDACSANINEEFPVGTQLIDTVTATDSDSKVTD